MAEPSVWKMRTASRWAMGGFFGVIGVLAVVGLVRETTSGSAQTGSVVFFCVALAACAAFVAMTFRASIVLTADEVVVRTLFRPQRIPLAEVIDATPASEGLVITRMNGRRVTAMGFKKSKSARAAGRRTYADQVSEAVRRAAGLGQGS